MTDAGKTSTDCADIAPLAKCVGSITQIILPLTPAQREDVLDACLRLNRLAVEVTFPNRPKLP